MESGTFRTPQKPFHRQSPTMKFVTAAKFIGTPQSKFKGPETPKSLARRTSGHFSLLPILNTPPSRFPKIINPFEAALTDRLHLPLICSPSLFQRPSTPQHSSTQFEWTIDEVSSLGPANVEPHETQFQATPDPELEAKAQAAISSYFKDQIIVPSPVDCPLRNRKIVLLDSNGSSPAVRSGRRIRDAVAQTVMTIPPVVPLEVENFLKTFLTYTADQQQSPTVNCDSVMIDYETQDISLRRKLFGVPSPHNEEDNDNSCDLDVSEIRDYEDRSPPPVTPDLDSHTPLRSFSSPFGNNSFGALSPISKLGSKQTTPKQDDTLNNTEPADLDFEVDLSKSPQQSSSVDGGEHNQSLFRSTPDRTTTESIIVDMSVDRSYNRSTNRLAVNSSKNLFPHDLDYSTSEQSFLIIDDDENMQVSQLSAKSTSSSGSSQHPDTPVRKRRSASRKNLSRSFSCPIIDDDDDQDGRVLFKKSATCSTIADKLNSESIATGTDMNTVAIFAMDSTEQSVFYRTDSGFNEMTTQDEADVNMC